MFYDSKSREYNTFKIKNIKELKELFEIKCGVKLTPKMSGQDVLKWNQYTQRQYWTNLTKYKNSKSGFTWPGKML